MADEFIGGERGACIERVVGGQLFFDRADLPYKGQIRSRSMADELI